MKDKICTVNGKRGLYTGFSKITNRHHISLFSGAVLKVKTLEGITFDGGHFPRLFKAIQAEKAKDAAKFAEGLKEYETAEKILGLGYYSRLITAANKRRQWELGALKTYLIERNEKQAQKQLLEQFKRLQTIGAAGEFTGASVSVEWKRSAMWGMNPTASAACYSAGHFVSGSIGGCGYDKLSTAVSDALNQSNALLKALYTFKEKRGPNANNRDLFGYGSGYGILPYLEGGVGDSCYPAIFAKIGFTFRKISSGKTFDVYSITKGVKK